MAETGNSVFDSTIEKTNLILKEIEQAYRWPKALRNQSYAALRSVLHALRDRLSINEGAQLAAQLPILVCGIFYHNWNPSRIPIKMRREEFLQRVQQEFPYDVEGGVEPLVKTVFQALRRHVSDGEWRDIKANVPKDMVSLLPDSDEVKAA